VAFIPGISGQKTELFDGVKVDTLNEYTIGNGVLQQGRTNGVAVTTGYVGEIISADTSVVTATWTSGTATAVMTSLSVTAGTWLLLGNAVGYNGVRGGTGTISLLGCDLYNSTDAAIIISNEFMAGWDGAAAGATYDCQHAGLNAMATLLVTATKTIQFRIKITSGGGSPVNANVSSRTGGKLYAIRIA
jgi:hypothetical protein